MTSTLPTTPPALMSAHRGLTLLVVLVSTRAPRLVKTVWLNVMWLLNVAVTVMP